MLEFALSLYLAAKAALNAGISYVPEPAFY